MELRKCADRNTELCCCNSYYIETIRNNQEGNKISPSPCGKQKNTAPCHLAWKLYSIHIYLRAESAVGVAARHTASEGSQLTDCYQLVSSGSQLGNQHNRCIRSGAIDIMH